jgi:hypothetical protein
MKQTDIDNCAVFTRGSHKQQITVYANINKGCISIKPKGEKVCHLRSGHIVLDECSFKVSKSGHKRIAQGGHREVCAKVTGTLHSFVNAQNISYNHSVEHYYDNLCDPEVFPIRHNPRLYPDRNYFWYAEPDGTYRVDIADRVWFYTSPCFSDSVSKTQLLAKDINIWMGR